jgi:hypothetical protein
MSYLERSKGRTTYPPAGPLPVGITLNNTDAIDSKGLTLANAIPNTYEIKANIIISFIA